MRIKFLVAVAVLGFTGLVLNTEPRAASRPLEQFIRTEHITGAEAAAYLKAGSRSEDLERVPEVGCEPAFSGLSTDR